MSKITYRLKDKNGNFMSPEYGRYEGILDECNLSDGTVIVQLKEIELIYQLTVTATQKGVGVPVSLHFEQGSDNIALCATGKHLCTMFAEGNRLIDIKWTVKAVVKE